MKISQFIGFKCLVAALLAAVAVESQAQTANWIGLPSGGEWNTAASWDLGAPPGVATNAVIGTGTNVSYNLPMTATSFGTLTLNGVLNVNTNGFNSSAISMLIPSGGDKLFINSNAVVVVTGNLTMGSNTVTTLAAGGALTVSSLIVDAGASSKAASTSYFTNNGGVLNANSTTINNNTGTGTGLLVVNGGTNNLGNAAVGRNNSGAGGLTQGAEGLVIYGGVVTMTNLNIGNAGNGASSLSTYVAGGAVTNFGSVFINQGTSGRFSRFLQTGGTFVVPDPGVINPNPTVSGSLNNYIVNAGTNILGGFFLGNSNATAGTINITNGGTMYIGSQGIANNGVATVTVALNNGGVFGATAPWTGSQTMKLNGGTFTFQTADMNGTANNITLTAALTGTGGLLVKGSGILTLGAANTYSGNTTLNGGTLALSSGTTLSSPHISIASGTTFDVSQDSGFTLGANQTILGSGTVTGAVAANSTAVIFPGSNSVTGTLTFNGGLTENGGVVNEFNLSGNPNGPGNDLLNVANGLVLSGVNTLVLNGSLQSGGAYPLINYNNNLTGDLSNFSVSGASGVLSNSASGIIYFIAQSSVRTPTNIVWIGNPVNNNWDVEVTTNWLNSGTSALDFFVPGDTALFSNLGATNPVVNISGGVTVTPAMLNVNTISNYTLTGNGAVGGVGGIDVSNGTLVVLTTNTYTGQTIFAGGTLVTPNIGASGSPSGIGAASTDPGNMIFNGGALAYDGATAATDHGMTFTNIGATIDVTNGTTLTLNGSLVGNGGLNLIDTGVLTLANANTYSGNTTINSGSTLNLDSPSGAGTGALVFNGGSVNLVLNEQQTYANNLTVNANSTLFSGGGNNNIVSGAWTGSGSVTLSVNLNGTSGTFSINGSMTNFLGKVELGNNSGFFRFNAGGGNTMNGGPNTAFDMGSNNVVFEARNPGTMAVGALFGGTSTSMKGPSSTAGMLIWQIGASPSTPNSLYFGSIQNSAANEVTSLSKVGNGTLTLGGQSSYTGSTTINSGTLALTNDPDNSSDGNISGSTNISIAAGAVLDVSGRTDDTMPLGSSQFLSGTGIINGILDTTGGGTVSPGGGVSGSLGTLTVTNYINLGGTAWMKINRASSPNSDRLVSSTASTINFEGTVVVTNVGASLHVNDTFTLFNATTFTGSPNVVLPNYYTWDTSQLAVNGVIKVTGILPPPTLANVDFSQLANGIVTINAANGAPNGPVKIVSSTTLTTPISGWSTVGTTTFDGSGNLSYSIAADPAAPTTFYALVAQ